LKRAVIRPRADLAVLAAWLAMPIGLAAQASTEQSARSQVFTLDQAIQYAVDHYPTVRAALEQINVSSAGVDVARAAYLPRLDSLWQSNRATANNVFGQILPQPVLPAMSGPVLASPSGQSVWGSATGALFTWEPVDFGLRRAAVAGADAALSQARAAEALTRLDVQGAVGAAFLSILAAQRAVTAAQADFDRRDTLARAVRTLVDNQLRPGADASRVDAERAAAQTRLIRAQEALALAETMMARLLGANASAVAIDAASLLERVPPAEVTPDAAGAHPLVRVRQAAVDSARAQQDVLARADLPRLYVMSSAFARGSGANVNGAFDGGADGLGFDRANWAAGIQVVFPNVFDFASLRARKTAAAALERAQSAQYDEAVLTIASQQEAAAAMLQASRAVAANTPVQLAAARQSETQASARYQAGLAGVTEVADAQSLLAQAEYQDELARVDIWRALLAQAVAQGTLASFLNLVRP
jgi:outer membrane protein TolC